MQLLTRLTVGQAVESCLGKVGNLRYRGMENRVTDDEPEFDIHKFEGTLSQVVRKRRRGPDSVEPPLAPPYIPGTPVGESPGFLPPTPYETWFDQQDLRTPQIPGTPGDVPVGIGDPYSASVSHNPESDDGRQALGDQTDDPDFGRMDPPPQKSARDAQSGAPPLATPETLRQDLPPLQKGFTWVQDERGNWMIKGKKTLCTSIKGTTFIGWVRLANARGSMRTKAR